MIVTIAQAREIIGRNPETGKGKPIPERTMAEWIRKGIINPIPGTRRITLAEIRRVCDIQADERANGKPPEKRKRGRYNKGAINP